MAAQRAKPKATKVPNAKANKSLRGPRGVGVASCCCCRLKLTLLDAYAERVRRGE